MKSIKIRPDIFGFYAKHYWLATIIAVVLVVGAIVLMGTFEFMVSAAMFLAGPLLVLWGAAHAYMSNRTTYLYLDREELIYETGILSHHKRVAPIHMITDSTIERSFIERMIGIADMHINTSGTTQIEIIADDFKINEIEKMHDEIYNLIRKSPSSLAKSSSYSHKKNKPNKKS